jgi:hypothetical protein
MDTELSKLLRDFSASPRTADRTAAKFLLYNINPKSNKWEWAQALSLIDNLIEAAKDLRTELLRGEADE